MVVLHLLNKSELGPIRDLRTLDLSAGSLRWPMVLETSPKPRHRLFLFCFLDDIKFKVIELKYLHRLVWIVEFYKTYSSHNINNKIQNIQELTLV